jgi:PadR family transcriptional regulator, regulatory protein PadR
MHNVYIHIAYRIFDGGEMMTEKHSLFCMGKPHHMERFLEVCLLMLLYDEIGYGYGRIEQLSFYGFSENELNVSTLYRTLRKMENESLVTSMWEEGGPGPKRRVYEITQTGKKDLDQWIQILKARKARIEKLIGKYDEKLGK